MAVASLPSLANPCPSAVEAIEATVTAAIVSGRQQILTWRERLEALSLACDQRGAMDHLAYFLDWESSRKRIPHLVLLEGKAGQLRGALLIHEYKVLGMGTRVFATDDTTGRRTLIAPAEERQLYARLAAEALLARGAQVVMLSVLDAGPLQTASAPAGRSRGWRMATRSRQIPSYLALGRTLDATLSVMGTRTRRNLRYYRRGAEAEFGCHFVPNVQIGRKGLQAFNRECTFAVTDELAGWRYDAVGKVPGMFLCGVRDRDGRWLSMAGARIFHDMVELDWQMNRAGMDASSLGTVMRSYFIEYAISLGLRRLYLEGGTPHSMRFSFVPEVVRDLIVVRHGGMAPLLCRAASRLPRKAFVFQVLCEPALYWRPWDAEPA